ncbi:hypothetical protein H6758_00945 [Candidatus Nomurabacteria bacterium]|nr:hypothetical protein [Candidatus Nomurabacteria bacterium]
MRIYVAGRYKKLEEIRKIYKILEEKKHTITNKWTEQHSIKPYQDNMDKVAQYLSEDFDGIDAADLFVLLAEYAADARGCHIELGYALRKRQIQGSPKIFVVYPQDNPSLFYLHANITLVDSFEKFLESMEEV